MSTVTVTPGSEELSARMGGIYVALNALQALAGASQWDKYSTRLRAEIAVVPEGAQHFYVGLLIFVYTNGDPQATEVDIVEAMGPQVHFGVQAALTNERCKVTTTLMNIGKLAAGRVPVVPVDTHVVA